MAETNPNATKPDREPNQPTHWFGLAYLLIFVAGVGFFLLSFIALGVLPGVRLAESMASYPKNEMSDYTLAELRGRHIYARMGCALCHSQQVRFLPADIRRWGAPTEAWETRYDFPQLWGTRRIGPDLAREAGVRSKDWQLTHLFKPQWIVPDSVMPAFPWLFNGRPDRPTADALDLVAYLQTLGRARQSSTGKHFKSHTDMDMSPLIANEINVLDELAFINPQQTHNQLIARGRLLFVRNCTGCHGPSGDGKGPAAIGLLPKPANLLRSRFSTPGLAQILWNGVAGSSMPAWREFTSGDLASLANYVQTLHIDSDVSSVDNTPAPAPTLAQGAVIYTKNCLRCHGVEGKGNGPDSTTLLPRPANFTEVQFDTEQILQVLHEGVAGTAMPAWPNLTTSEKQAVSAFVRSIFNAPKEQNP